MSTKNDRQLDLFADNAKLSPTQRVTLDRLVRTLNVLPVHYAIRAVDGSLFCSKGNPDYTPVWQRSIHGVAPAPKRAKRIKRSPYPRGELSGYVAPYLRNNSAGVVVRIPVGKYPPKLLTKTCTESAVRLWGKGAFAVRYLESAKEVEVLRLV